VPGFRSLALAFVAVSVIPGLTANATAGPTTNPVFNAAFQRMYNFDFPAAQSIMDRYISTAPDDPFGYTVRGAAYLYSELDRMGILQSDFFVDDNKISGSKTKLKPDPRVRDSFYTAVNKAQSLSQAALDKSPNDTSALFAMSLALGELSDYMALVEKRQVASLSFTKRAYREAKRLLSIDNSYVDAYLTTGFTEYLVGSLPVVVRWFVRFDDVQGDKAEGFRTLTTVAEKGHYLKALAKILLATGYIREKKPLEARKLLAELTQEYPENPLLKHEYQKITVRINGGS
jgi:tetratricopeptide (TPR) repeat protein